MNKNEYTGEVIIVGYGTIQYNLARRNKCFLFLSQLSWARQVVECIKKRKDPNDLLDWNEICRSVLKDHKESNLEEVKEYCHAQLLIQQLS